MNVVDRLSYFGFLAIIVLAVVLAGCTPTVAGSPSASTQGCPAGVPSTINRLDFVVVGSIRYLAPSVNIGRQLTDGDLRAPYSTVHCMLADLRFDPSYDELHSGNAAFLSPGTVVYSVKGYASYFRLAARRNGVIVDYEADLNPSAKIGGDLLDLAAKVQTISINSATGDDRTPIATITAPTKVASLSDMVLTAPVDQHVDAGHEGVRYFLVFNLKDGTAVTRAYWPSSGELSRGIFTTQPFRTTVQEALVTKP